MSGQRSGDQDFTRLSELLSEAGVPRRSRSRLHSPTTQSPSADTSRRIADMWADAVGDEIAANAHPVQLRGGRLVIAASSSAWAQTLQLMNEDIRARLNERLGSEAISTIFCRHAGWARRSAAETEPEPTVSRRRKHDEAMTAGTDTNSSTGGGPTVVEAQTQDLPEDLNAEQRAALESIDGLGMSTELSTRVYRAMRAAFVRGER
ncbi:MAG: DUF721 domain-containing protein [Thermoleophilia bacterium]|jgi:hypothetical protein